MSKIMQSAKSSWKTTVTGILQFLVLLWTQLQFLWDANPATMPDWGLLISSVIILIGLITARDGNVSSEQAGVISIKARTQERP